MNITIQSKDVRTIWELREGPLPEGVSIQVSPTLQDGGISVTGLKSPVAIISVTADAQIHPLTDWLYEKIKDRHARLTINHTQVEIDKNEIARVLQAEMTKG